MIYYDDIVGYIATNYTLQYPIDYPGIGPLDTATKQSVSQPDNEPFIKLYVTPGSTNNAVILTGDKNLTREPFTVVIEILLPRTTHSSQTIYTPALISTFETHLDTFMIFRSLQTNEGGYIYSAFDRPKFKSNSQARNDDHFTSTVIQYNYNYDSC